MELQCKLLYVSETGSKYERTVACYCYTEIQSSTFTKFLNQPIGALSYRTNLVRLPLWQRDKLWYKPIQSRPIQSSTVLQQQKFTLWCP
jgi:hypothetical protein